MLLFKDRWFDPILGEDAMREAGDAREYLESRRNDESPVPS